MSSCFVQNNGGQPANGDHCFSDGTREKRRKGDRQTDEGEGVNAKAGDVSDDRITALVAAPLNVYS